MTQHSHKNGAYAKTTLHWIGSCMYSPCPREIDICTKQCRLSGHQWIHGFDFTSAFYAVTIPKEYWLYLAYNVEGKEIFTLKQMPYSLVGAPATFSHITSTTDSLSDLLLTEHWTPHQWQRCSSWQLWGITELYQAILCVQPRICYDTGEIDI